MQGDAPIPPHRSRQNAPRSDWLKGGQAPSRPMGIKNGRAALAGHTNTFSTEIKLFPIALSLSLSALLFSDIILQPQRQSLD